MEFKNIVVIDDEMDILEILQYNFEKEGASVHTFTSGVVALAYMKENIPDVIVSDWMMPDMAGLELYKKIKEDPDFIHTPFVMLTARGQESDVVNALETGVEDYIVKPVRIKELVARLNKIASRQKVIRLEEEQLGKAPYDQGNMLKYREITVNLEKHKAYLDDKPVDLTYSEFKILQLLIDRKGKVYSRNQIIERLNGMEYEATERSVDVQIVGLRKKIGPLRDYLETVRGVGYRIRD